MLMPGVFVYRGGPARGDDDPVDVIGRALSEALVHYYPLAGRFREVEGGKLVVDCTGEGVLFAEADADLARGLPAPAVAPSWSRGLLDAPHIKHDVAPPLPFPAHGSDEPVMRSFVFRFADIASLKKRLPGAPAATTFEVLAALLWRARTVALALPPGEVARLGIIASFRRNGALRLPTGYYGNACVPLRAAAPADDMGGSSLGDVVEMIQKAKATAAHVRSAADMLALHGPPPFDSPNMFLLSDLRHVGFHRVDFGWGEPVYGGPSQVHLGGTFFVSVKDGDGEDAVAVPVTLPRTAMGRFAAEIETSLKA